MQKSFLEFSKTGILPPLVSDYLNDVKSVSEFYNYRPEISSFEKTIQQKQKEDINRKILVEVLQDQYKGIFKNNFEFNSKVKSNIDLLLNENTFTVTTGHQLNIFSGPLYFLFKIISTINLSEKLKQHYPKYNFIPVYWMASEDHDFEEINHINLFGKKISWQQSQEGACGRFHPASLAESIEDLKMITGESSEAKRLMDLFISSYLSNSTLADATRFLVHSLFSKYGLVIIDGDDKKLKSEFSKIMEDDLKNNSAFKLVNETISKLEKKYKVQVHPREINLFYLQENSRERILSGDSQFTIHSSQLRFSHEQILKELADHPENFSPNVVLRPLYAEKVLPNLAYIGGPAEINYWLEYKPMFDYYKTNFPVLILRNSVLWLDKGTVSRMQKLGVTIEDLFLPEELLVKNFLIKKSEELISLQKEINEMENIFEIIKQKAYPSDQSLITSIESEKQKMTNSLKNLESKIIRAEKKRQETNIHQLKKVKEKIFPENSFQERYENFIPYYLKYGETFFDLLKTNLDPFNCKLVILNENENQ